MGQSRTVKTSRFLSFVLRHHPESIGLSLDQNGWVEVDLLLSAMKRQGRGISRSFLEQVVATNDKKRFAFSDDGSRIRASQGHSLSVDLALETQAPPEVLYHGTVASFLASIRSEGLKPGSRQHVHLSIDRETARKVGQRRGKPVILRIAAKTMQAQGHQFYCSANGVWLVDWVPPEFLS